MSADPALSDYLPKAPIDDEAKKYNENLPGQGGVFNMVNFHLYHYAGNNPVKYTDPDGKQVTRNQYNSYVAGKLQGAVHSVKAAFSDIAGKVGNFLSNAASGNANTALSMSATLNIGGTPLNGSASYSTDNGLSFSTSIDNIDSVIGALTDLAGSPIKINAGGVEVTSGVATVEIKQKDSKATVTFKLTSKDILKGIDLSMGLSKQPQHKMVPVEQLIMGKIIRSIMT